MTGTPTKPYFVRAIYEWSVDNDFTPYLMVDACMEYVQVPVDFVEDGKIVLNISTTAVQSLMMTNEVIEFSARFGGKATQIHVPIGAVLGIYAKENGQGLFFDTEASPEPEPDGPEGNPPAKSSFLKVVK